eukprot:7651061-Pyramimonas_sp.AAC.1
MSRLFLNTPPVEGQARLTICVQAGAPEAPKELCPLWAGPSPRAAPVDGRVGPPREPNRRRNVRSQKTRPGRG